MKKITLSAMMLCSAAFLTSCDTTRGLLGGSPNYRTETTTMKPVKGNQGHAETNKTKMYTTNSSVPTDAPTLPNQDDNRPETINTRASDAAINAGPAATVGPTMAPAMIAPTAN